jgi:hypothetical protein
MPWQFHGVIQRPVGRGAEVEQLHRVRRAQRRGDLGFAREALDHGRARLFRHAQAFGEDQLHGGWPREHEVAGLPHFAHAALVDQAHQLIATHALRCGHFLSHAVERACGPTASANPTVAARPDAQYSGALASTAPCRECRDAERH